MIIKIYENLCKGIKGCGNCIEVCPKKLFINSGNLNKKGYILPKIVNPNQCIHCKKCELICPEMAISVLEESG